MKNNTQGRFTEEMSYIILRTWLDPHLGCQSGLSFLVSLPEGFEPPNWVGTYPGGFCPVCLPEQPPEIQVPHRSCGGDLQVC